MLLCPHCNKQYDDGFTVCALCGQDLIEYTPLVSEEELEVDALEGEESPSGSFQAEKVDLDENEPQLLVTVTDRVEAGRILALLQDMEIPCLKKTRGVGNYSEIMWGKSVTGYDIYVPGALMRQAMEALSLVPEESFSEEESEELWPEELESDFQEEGMTFEEPVDSPEDEEALEESARRIWVGLLIAGLVVAVGGIAIVLLNYFFG